MENDSNPLPQKTGGLKMMTVFIAVLALHVVVILGITVYHLFNSGTSDEGLIAADKTHKDVKVTPDGATVSDGTLPDGTTTSGKTGTADTASDSPITIPNAPASNGGDASATASTSAGTPAPATSAVSGPETASTDTTTPVANPSSGPIITVPASNPSQPSGPVQMQTAGPVITPAQAPAPSTSETAIDAPPAATTGTVSEEGASTYTIKPGDSLARIAHRHHIKLSALIAANNGVKSKNLQIGQKLNIPAAATTPATADAPATASTDSTVITPAVAESVTDADKTQLDGKVATTAKPKHHHFSSEPNRTLLGDSPEINSPENRVAATAHDKAMVSSGGHHIYTVSKGDTLSKIAHRFHTSPNAIMALNDISSAHKLRLGQKLRIPTHESRSATSAPVATPVTPQQQQQHQDEIEPRATPSAQLANFIN